MRMVNVFGLSAVGFGACGAFAMANAYYDDPINVAWVIGFLGCGALSVWLHPERWQDD